MSELDEEDADSVTRILAAGRHLLALINEFIDIARIKSGDLRLSLEPVLVGQVLEEVSELMAPIAAERSIRVIQQCARPALAVQADRQRFSPGPGQPDLQRRQVQPPGGHHTISCRENGAGQASIMVSDTGPGISLENIERISVPSSGSAPKQTAVEGTGIGLPLARALTDAMSGELAASSVLGQGSTFTLSLPRVPDLVHVPVTGLVPAALVVAEPDALVLPVSTSCMSRTTRRTLRW